MSALRRQGSRRVQLHRDLLWLGVGVAEQHPQITMTANHRDLWDIQSPLKKSADGLMSKIMKAQLEDTGSSSKPLPRKPDCVGGNSEDGGTAARQVPKKL